MVTIDVIAIWENASIPTISENSITRKIEKAIISVKNINTTPIASRNTEYFFAQIEKFDELFDISPCKCFDSDFQRTNCKCPIKIALCEYPFCTDQKTERLQIISGIDKNLTARLCDRAKRVHAKGLSIQMEDKQKKYCVNKEISDNIYSIEREESLENMESIDDPTIHFNNSLTIQSQNCNNYDTLAATADRFRSSSREVVALVNAVLIDLNMLTPETALSYSKIQQERKKARKSTIRKLSVDRKSLSCVMFDGRRDRTLTISESNSSYSLKSIEMEEHIALLSEPGSKYIDHVTPESGKSRDIAHEILSVLSETDSSDSLIGIGCDGCATNTGNNAGVIRRLELSLDRPLQWMICMLHLNELPFRHLFDAIDGRTTGPKSFIGDIGKELNRDLRLLPLQHYKPIEGCIVEIPSDVLTQLSSNQLYLYQIGMSVQKGESYLSNSDITFRAPGELHHARWLTRANRILRLYVSKSNPSQSLEKIVHFLVSFYIPGWFHIKQHPLCTDGAKKSFI